MYIDKVIEVWNIEVNDIWYEVHVDSTNQFLRRENGEKHRVIVEVFAEKGEVTDDVHNELQDLINGSTHMTTSFWLATKNPKHNSNI